LEHFSHERTTNAVTSEIFTHVDGFDFGAEATSMLNVPKVEQFCHSDDFLVAHRNDDFAGTGSIELD